MITTAQSRTTPTLFQRGFKFLQKTAPTRGDRVTLHMTHWACYGTREADGLDLVKAQRDEEAKMYLRIT